MFILQNHCLGSLYRSREEFALKILSLSMHFIYKSSHMCTILNDYCYQVRQHLCLSLSSLLSVEKKSFFLRDDNRSRVTHFDRSTARKKKTVIFSLRRRRQENFVIILYFAIVFDPSRYTLCSAKYLIHIHTRQGFSIDRLFIGDKFGESLRGREASLTSPYWLENIIVLCWVSPLFYPCRLDDISHSNHRMEIDSLT